MVRSMGARFRLLAVLVVFLGCSVNPDPPAGRCRYDSDCASGSVCADTVCRIACHVDRDCPTGQRCQATDRPNVSACQPATTQAQCRYTSDCADGLYCLEGMCRVQCVADYDCQVINPYYRCAAGQCQLPCTPQVGNCDDNPRNGCETDLQSSTTHCGQCGHTCPGSTNAAGVCTAGACRIGCNAGFGDCDGNTDNGCETDLQNDASRCGACGTSCATPVGGSAQCTAGVCGKSCATGRGDCDHDATNGCESNLQTDVGQCGACGHACATPAGGSATCTAGVCGIACSTGRGDCDHDATNGCETDLQTTVAQCGACGTACPERAHAVSTCAAGACGMRCVEGFADCDGNAANGCEADLGGDALHCGTCDGACPVLAHTAAACSGAPCTTHCLPGFGDCDGDAANGCEADLGADPSHCGACATACSVANGTAACTAGACAVAACTPGFGDCDHDPATGCEARIDTAANCGACGTACTGDRICSAGACVLSCATGSVVCGGACVDTRSDPLHCGGCDTACPARANATAGCTGSTCGFHCNVGYEDCNGLAADGCEVRVAVTSLLCGTTMCGARPNAFPSCSTTGACNYVCAVGWGDCNGLPADGCEAPLDSVTNCGTCGTACPAATTAGASSCVRGRCSALCPAGRGDCDGNADNGCEVDLLTSPTNCGICGNTCRTGTCSAGACPLIVRTFGGPTGIGTSCLPPNDDGSWGGPTNTTAGPPAAIDISTAFPMGLHYFANTYTSMYVNNNGNISFAAGISTFTPAPFPIASQPMIAPWWADVDTRGGGQPTNNNVCFAVEPGRIAVTWDNVGYYGSHIDKLNTFQVLITSPGIAAPGDFDLEFRYTRCEWTTGDASSGSGGLGGTPAQVGFDAGDSTTFYALPTSRTAGILGVCTQSNVGVPGVWRFHVRGGALTPAVCENPAPPAATATPASLP